MTLPRFSLVASMLCLTLFGLVGRAATTLVPWGDNFYGQTNIPAGLTNVVAIAGSSSHSLALSMDGTVTAWGWNFYGQGGVPPALTNVTAIAAGGAHNLAVTALGTVFAWGDNFYGQTDVPARLSNVVAVAAGASHSLALLANGTVVAWGNDTDGQASVPHGLTNVVAIAAGGWHSLALMGNGKMVAWGYNGYGQTDVPMYLKNVIAISAGALHTMALDLNGQLLVWGDNSDGQADVPEGLSNVVAIAAGAYHSMALKADGTVVAWGNNDSGQTEVPPGLTNVTAIAPRSLAFVGEAVSRTFIIETPANRIAAVGAPAFFRVTARGFQPLTYQWLLGGRILPGATNALLWLDNVLPAQAGAYNVMIYNALGWLAVAGARLDVVPLWLSAQPEDQFRTIRGSVSFDAVVESTLPVTYQWHLGSQDLHDDGRISGASTPHLSISNIGFADAGAYVLIASNDYGAVTSQVATLSVTSSPPALTCQPQSQTVLAGSNVTFSVCVQSPYDFSVQWFSNGVALAGKTATDLFFLHAVPEYNAEYSCLVSNIDGAVFSGPATLEVLPFPPVITVQPQSTNVLVDAMTNAGFYLLSVTAAGPDLRYLWYKNGSWVLQTPLAYFLRLYPECDTTFDCYVLVSNRYGTVTSSVAQVSFDYLPPYIMTQPVSGTVEWGSAYGFYIQTTYTPSPLWCQWRHNGQPIPGENQLTLLVNDITTNLAGIYDVVVSNCSGGFVWSAPASLTVLMDPPQFTQPPTNLALPLGSDAAFSCIVTGALPLRFQWRFNGQPLANETNATLSFRFTNAVQIGTYTLVASNLFGVASAGAALAATNLVLSEAVLLSTGEFEFKINNPSLAPCRLQASEDLLHWEDIFTFSNTQAITLYRDPDAPFYPRLFYRVVSP